MVRYMPDPQVSQQPGQHPHGLCYHMVEAGLAESRSAVLNNPSRLADLRLQIQSYTQET